MALREGVDYHAYLRSDAWASQRIGALSRARNRCERCGTWDELQVHHRTYARLGYEDPEDLEVLCRDCHQGHHRTESNLRNWEARVNAWAERRWGDDWEYDRDYRDVEAQFEEWLEERGER